MTGIRTHKWFPIEYGRTERIAPQRRNEQAGAPANLGGEELDDSATRFPVEVEHARGRERSAAGSCTTRRSELADAASRTALRAPSDRRRQRSRRQTRLH